MVDLIFEPLSKYQAGIIERLLTASYAGLMGSEAEQAEFNRRWRQADRKAFENPDTIGRCVFVSCVAGEAIGLGALDPTEGPERGEVGHNCILPEYRRRGYGSRQIEETLGRMRQRGIGKAIVRTGEHAFFAAAQRMYLRCGFREIDREWHSDHADFRVITYEMEL